MRKKPIGSTLLQRKGGKASGKLNMINNNSDLVTAKDVSDGGMFGAGSIDGSGAGGSAPVAFDATSSNPPYSYSDTDSANCASLSQMIAAVENTLTYIRLSPEGLAAYNEWLVYAKNRFGTQCAVSSGGDVSVENPPVVISDPNAPVEVQVLPNSDQPGLVQTVTPPSNVPYTSGGSGGDDGSGDGLLSKKKGLLLLGILIMVTGAFIHSKA